MEILQYGFMQRALLAGVVVGILCPLIGIFIVLRRMSLIGDSLSHIALSGVAAGILTGVYPLTMALIFSIFAALGIEKLRKNYREYVELSIAIILSAGIGLAVVLISLSKSLNVDLFGYLFGSITAVMPADIWVILVLGLFIILIVKFLYKELFYISFDEISAKLAGVPVNYINLLFIVLVASTITLSMRIVGILLVSSLMIIPVATSLQIAKSFKHVIFYSIVFAEISVISGIIISFYLELASGGTIVIISVLILLLVLFIKKINKNRLKRKVENGYS
ncbi:zinc transport system permease protein [Caminicella sporogenes DSM 14501]|uniref:Zinc transport system permease protein n=1 Tax=Caminicella sporogenes DSM 14501 TaxID=1121266 RepID=A0A1M6T477_9FIRM|nr:metal ABC transporter permease [Caminicella sporogenes]RKD25485.1 metal ABC transporter permease [Caminicella sporogenes]SHK51813.1 zinc transport system permease protein [Caminicella sporogenes DSM 14501]